MKSSAPDHPLAVAHVGRTLRFRLSSVRPERGLFSWAVDADLCAVRPGVVRRARASPSAELSALGWVSFEFQIDQPQFVVTVDASLKTSPSSFETHLEVHPNDVIEIRAEYVNTGTNQQNDVTIRFEKLPKGLRYIPGTVVVANGSTGRRYEPDIDAYWKTGADVGSYQAHGGNVCVKVDVMVQGSGSPGYSTSSKWLNVDPAVTVSTPNGSKSTSLGVILLQN
jgi:hypothetical protein